MPALPALPVITVPPQLLTLVAALIAIVLVWGFFNGLYHVADGLATYGSSKGQKQKREEAINTARDGAIGSGLCVAGAAIIGAIILIVRG